MCPGGPEEMAHAWPAGFPEQHHDNSSKKETTNVISSLCAKDLDSCFMSCTKIKNKGLSVRGSRFVTLKAMGVTVAWGWESDSNQKQE